MTKNDALQLLYSERDLAFAFGHDEFHAFKKEILIVEKIDTISAMFHFLTNK